MIIYITGCLGFIGSYVTKACLDKGWYVYGIDKYGISAPSEVALEMYGFVKEDVAEYFLKKLS